MNYVTGGPSGQNLKKLTNGTSHVMIVWDHARTPGCANSKIAAPRVPGSHIRTPQPIPIILGADTMGSFTSCFAMGMSLAFAPRN